MYKVYCENKIFEFETLEELYEKEKELLDLINNTPRRSAIIDLEIIDE